eukprot:COSAG04_NODE_17497_length_468_cov_0.430894_2_plen_65_part_00
MNDVPKWYGGQPPMLLLSKRKTARELCDAGFVNEVLPSGDGFLPAVYERIRAGLVRRAFCSGCV